MTTQSALLERLEAIDPFVNDPVSLMPRRRNPDGPEAAALIRSMQETIDRLEEEMANSIQFAGGQSPLVCGSGTASNVPDRNPASERIGEG